ncbi:MAG: efflux RND transporter permease subunit [Magnetococcales bacterium]|nr:efflux RND transporter permease subunit [Magnetococcales bacterium]
MSLVRTATRRPVAVTVGVLLIVLFGALALWRIPVQLTPDVRKPMITVETLWPGASPMEVEGELTIPQEDVLKSIPGLDALKSSSRFARSKVTMEFRIGTDMDAAMVLVSNRLQRIRNAPDEALRPTLKSADSEDRPITWIRFQRLDPHDQRSVAGELDFVEDVVQTALERIPGVATVNIYGGRERELRVTINPERMAARRVTVSALADALRRENRDISAGKLDEGKRSYLVRTLGRFTTPEQAAAVVVRSDETGPVTVGDVATVGFDFAEATVHVRGSGRPILAINAVREQSANVITIMKEVRTTLAQLNQHHLNPKGFDLTLLHDQTDYIHQALDLARNNLIIGGVLAMVVLWLFLRTLSATAIIGLAIPVSLVGAFLAMAALGRTVNVVSLAGLAFAVGMVVDPAIVALENIVRLRDGGLSSEEAAVRGVGQVWGAILISTLTTVAVFLPILALEIEAAQLFGDIAVALCAAVLFSLAVSATVIPTLSVRLLQRRTTASRPINTPSVLRAEDGTAPSATAETSPHATPKAGIVTRTILAAVDWINRTLLRRLLLAGGLIAGVVMMTISWLPPAEYLPAGSRNLIFAMLIPPPGYNLEEMSRMAGKVESALIPHLAETPLREGPAINPQMRHFFFVARGSIAFMGGSAMDPTRVRELMPVIRKPVSQLPGTFGIVKQTSIFGRGISAGRSLDLAITGPDLEPIMATARKLFGQTQSALSGSQVRPIPGLALANPELQLIPNRQRAAENGLSTHEIGQAVDAFTDGLKVDEILVDGKAMDLMLRGHEGLTRHTQDATALPLVTPRGEIIPVGAVADPKLTAGPVQIERLDRERAVSLRITPPREMAMESAINTLRREVIAPATAQGLPPGVKLRLTEGADQLTQAKRAMGGQFILALIITYLLMAALFESFLYPLIIIITAPLAVAGGVIGLKIFNIFTFQPLDVLTMLGFVILIGVVVNNAILLVHQALAFMRDEGMSPHDAMRASTAIRIRPIFMSSFTSAFGMLPLVIFPGAGSELYRGLGSVVAAGLLFSTFLTLILTPTLFSLAMSARLRLSGK